MPENPKAIDFAELKRIRDRNLEEVIREVCAKYKWNPEEVLVHVSPQGCYCACPDGPCEHHFTGWRPFEDENGGEQVCKLCGMGAMSHSMRTAE